MSASILITGATGNVGREVVNALTAEGVSCCIGVRNPARVADQFGDRVEVRAFDFLDETTYDEAFEGITSLFLVRPPSLANVNQEIRPALDFAVGRDVSHIVFLSLQGVENAKITPHYKIEQLIRSYDVDYTFLRAGFFMQNLTTTHRDEIRDEDVIAVPVGRAKTSFIDVRDIGAVGAKTLVDAQYRNKSYTLTGSEALTYFQVADIISDVLGRKIQYTHPNPISFFIRMLRRGHAFGYALVVTALYSATRAGNAEAVTDDVPDILGHDPITFTQFAQDYRDMWLA